MEDSGRNGRQCEVTGMWDSNICLALRHYLSPLFSSVTQLCLTLQPHGLQHARLPCPSPTPRACSNSCPSSWWFHPAISSCHPLFFLPSVLTSIRVFSNETVLHIRWPKDWSFSFRISPSNEYSELISFRIDRLDLLVVQGTLRTLLQHHSTKASILQCTAFWSNSHIHTWLLEKP